MTCPRGPWPGGPQSPPDRLPGDGGGGRACLPSSTWLKADASAFPDLPDIIWGLDFGRDPVPTRSLSTFQGLPGRQSQEPAAGWEGLQEVMSPALRSGNLGT